MKTGDWTMTTEAFRQWMMGFKCFFYVWKWSIPQHDRHWSFPTKAKRGKFIPPRWAYVWFEMVKSARSILLSAIFNLPCLIMYYNSKHSNVFPLDKVSDVGLCALYYILWPMHYIIIPCFSQNFSFSIHDSPRLISSMDWFKRTGFPWKRSLHSVLGYGDLS